MAVSSYAALLVATAEELFYYTIACIYVFDLFTLIFSPGLVLLVLLIACYIETQPPQPAGQCCYYGWREIGLKSGGMIEYCNASWYNGW